MGHKGPVYKAQVHRDCMGSKPNINLNLNLKEQREVMNHTKNTDNLIIFPN